MDTRESPAFMPKTGDQYDEISIPFTISAQLLRTTQFSSGLFCVSLGLRCRQKLKFKVTTDSRHNLPIAPNLLDQQFTVSAPNRVWVTDITYVATDEGWLYLAGIKDLFNGELVGYALDERMTQNLMMQALFRAVAARRPGRGLVHHSDRGSQYCAHAYQRLLRQFGMHNRIRKQARLDYLSPAAFMQQYYEKQISA